MSELIMGKDEAAWENLHSINSMHILHTPNRKESLINSRESDSIVFIISTKKE